MKWLTVPIANFCKTGSGGTPSRAELTRYYGGHIPWVKSGELKDDVLNATEEHITNEALAESSAKLVPAGAVLVAMYGATVGKTSILGVEATTNQAICHLLPNKKVADARFVWYALRAKLLELLSRRVGGAQPNISQQIIRNTFVSLPPLSEQHRIVELLDQADALRKKRALADERAARILPALFIKMFGDPATNPMEWERNQLETVINETQYGTSVKANTEGNGVVVLRMNNIDTAGYLNLRDLKYIVLQDEELHRQRLEAGDILFNRTNSKELVGKTGLWHETMEAVAASYLIRVRVNRKRVLPEFVWAYMNTPFMKQMLFDKARRAIGMANINATELRSFPIIIPDIEVQRSFAAKLTNLNSLNERRTDAREKINQLFNTLLHRAFSGELTAKWREAHMKELLAEMEIQKRELGVADTQEALSF